MHSSFLVSPCPYSFLYFCKFTGSDEDLLELASFVSLNNEDHFFGFDRSLWSSLSSGQMPSQLYSFNFYGSSNGCSLDENVFLIFAKQEIKSFPLFVEREYSLNLDASLVNDGELVDSFEEDDEFENCLYVTCLIWDKFDGKLPEVEQARNTWFQSGDKKVQLLTGNSIYKQDEWVEAFFQDPSFNQANKVLSAVHLLLPCSEKLKSLEEAVQDKERIHLDPEIKGIYC